MKAEWLAVGEEVPTLMSLTTKSLVNIKGIKDGLLFVLDDTAPLKDVLSELQRKLNTHDQFLNGPIVHVHVKTGKRHLTEEVKASVRFPFAQRGNMLVQSIVGDPPANGQAAADIASLQFPAVKTIAGIVRSGQTLRHQGNLLLLGDVNPGGTVICTGNIFILGSLRGLAHAGSEGDEDAVIAASHLRPTQLRIAGVVSRPPDEWGFQEAVMEFAYLREGSMEIEKMHQLHRIKPHLGERKGE